MSKHAVAPDLAYAVASSEHRGLVMPIVRVIVVVYLALNALLFSFIAFAETWNDGGHFDLLSVSACAIATAVVASVLAIIRVSRRRALFNTLALGAQLAWLAYLFQLRAGHLHGGELFIVLWAVWVLVGIGLAFVEHRAASEESLDRNAQSQRTPPFR